MDALVEREAMEDERAAISPRASSNISLILAPSIAIESITLSTVQSDDIADEAEDEDEMEEAIISFKLVIPEFIYPF